ncbi:unnamed protein product [Nyctereutes procyonoides]|uniref:(raccoon dog) hypothetical protein n=1 Tax=Nyctereutes procyonoides TaxID=34880 RepID=A0A811YR20_NYCPR|nr:unnamed protein product [Nyctereutes procyonoides]
MAKNKLRGQKSRSVFHIASQKNFKSKNKINIANDEKVNRVNKAFVDIFLQKNLQIFCHENEPVNVDEATRLMAQL